MRLDTLNMGFLTSEGLCISLVCRVSYLHQIVVGAYGVVDIRVAFVEEMRCYAAPVHSDDCAYSPLPQFLVLKEISIIWLWTALV